MSVKTQLPKSMQFRSEVVFGATISVPLERRDLFILVAGETFSTIVENDLRSKLPAREYERVDEIFEFDPAAAYARIEEFVSYDEIVAHASTKVETAWHSLLPALLAIDDALADHRNTFETALERLDGTASQ